MRGGGRCLVLGVVGSPAASRDSVAKGIPPNAEGLHAWDAAYLQQIAYLIEVRQAGHHVSLEPLERSVFPARGAIARSCSRRPGRVRRYWARWPGTARTYDYDPVALHRHGIERTECRS